jgi:hypothetical protein
VGGDGTFHECTNGIMKRMLADGAARIPPMALIAAGTGTLLLLLFLLLSSILLFASSSTALLTRSSRHHRLPLRFLLLLVYTGNSFMHELGYAKLKDAVHHICRGTSRTHAHTLYIVFSSSSSTLALP